MNIVDAVLILTPRHFFYKVQSTANFIVNNEPFNQIPESFRIKIVSTATNKKLSR